MHKLLITGGSGFIGTQVAFELGTHSDYEITTVDRQVKNWKAPGTVIECDFLDFFTRYEAHYDTVIHFAADHIVENSVSNPAKYYENNVIKMKGMLDYMVKLGIKNI